MSPRDPLSPEIRWLLALCAAPETPPPSALNGSLTLKAAQHHRLILPLGNTLARHLPAPEDRAAAAMIYHRHLGRTMLRLRLAQQIFAGLSAANLPGLLFKGPGFSLALGLEPLKRGCRDLDLLVRPSDLGRLNSLLSDFGFTCTSASPLEPAGEIVWRLENPPAAWNWAPQTGGAIIEVHTHLTHNAGVLPLSAAQILDQALPVRLGGQTLATLPVPLALSYAAYHGFNHAWTRLFWVKDFSDALRLPEGRLDWQAIWAEAERLGLQHFLGQAVALAHDLMQAPLPAGPFQQRLYRQAAPLFWPSWTFPLPNDGEMERGQFLARIGWGRYARAAFRLHSSPRRKLLPLLDLLRPTETDYNFWPLPARWRGLYWLIRPIRLLTKRRWRIKASLDPPAQDATLSDVGPPSAPLPPPVRRQSSPAFRPLFRK